MWPTDWTGSDWAQVIVATSSFGSMLLTWRNAIKIEQVHIATNSMKDALVVATDTAARGEGRKQGYDEASIDLRDKIVLAARTASDTKTAAAEKAADTLATAKEVAREKLKDQ